MAAAKSASTVPPKAMMKNVRNRLSRTLSTAVVARDANSASTGRLILLTV